MLDQHLLDRTWLVLIGHADRLGIVTRCTTSQLADYLCVSARQARELVDALEVAGALKRLPTAGHRAHYRLLGPWQCHVLRAQQVLDEEGTRVRSLQNQRSRVYEKTRAGLRAGPTFRIIDPQQPTANGILRFDLSVDGVCTIRDCAVIRRTDGTTFFSEPRKPLGEGWERTCAIDPALAQAVMEAALHTRTTPVIGADRPSALRVFDWRAVAVDGTRCRRKLCGSVEITGVLTVYGCAMVEPLEGNGFFSAPTKYANGRWLKTVEFAPDWTARIVRAVTSSPT